ALGVDARQVGPHDVAILLFIYVHRRNVGHFGGRGAEHAVEVAAQAVQQAPGFTNSDVHRCSSVETWTVVQNSDPGCVAESTGFQGVDRTVRTVRLPAAAVPCASVAVSTVATCRVHITGGYG